MVTFKGKPLHLVGTLLKIGDHLPSFTLTGADMKTVSAESFHGKTLLISTVPSLDTAVCSLQSKHFEEEAVKYPDVQLITVSMDLPFAQARWAKESACSHMPLFSDYKEHSFAKATGLLINELKLLARAVHIFDKEGRLVYQEIVAEMTEQPDYAKALQALSA